MSVNAIVATALTVLSLYLHLQNFNHAGALWRDEVNTIELASEKSLASTFANLQFDSFPLLWFVVLKSFMRLAGSEDYALRALGLGIGLLSLFATWINARLFGHRLPVLALLLIGINGAVIRFGDSLRGYGLGLLTGTLMFGALWNLTRRMTPGTATIALFTALLAVHSLLYNSVFLLAACMGGVAVMHRRRSVRGALVILGIGLTCALSLAIYVPWMRAASNWNDLVRYDLGISWFWDKWEEALQMSGRLARPIWTAIFLLAGAGTAFFLRRKDETEERKEVATFSMTTLAVGLIGYVAFLAALRYETEPWYYLTFMAMSACSLDPLSGLLKGWRINTAMAIAVLIVALLFARPVLNAVRNPHTNIDLLARKISRESAPADLIFVFPWQVGISFQRYFDGPARWQTVPPLGSHRWHRYDLFKSIVSDEHALDTFLRDVEQRLVAGGRVWIVAPTGFLENPRPRLFPAHNPRLPKGEHLWRMRLSVLLSNHRRRTEFLKTKSVPGSYEYLILDVGAVPEPNNDQAASGSPR